MWTSPGDITNQTLEVVDDGDIHVTGMIDDHSVVVLISKGGSITIDGKIDGHSNVTLKAAGNVTIGAQGGDDDRNIDGNCGVEVVAGADISLGGYIHKAAVNFSAHGAINMGEIDFEANVRLIADGNVSVKGKINGRPNGGPGPSRVDIVSNRGSITIDGKIDGQSKISLTAAQDIGIGGGIGLGDDDRKIGGNSSVTATAGNSITLDGEISGDHTSVDFASAGSIAIGKSIKGGANVRLLSVVGKIQVNEAIADNGTQVTFWPPNALNAKNDGQAQILQIEWMAGDTLTIKPVLQGYWWQNWPQTFGYVTRSRVVPRSLNDIVNAVAAAGATSVKAVGGGWSFTDASLPLLKQAEVDNASIRLRGASQRQDMRHVLEGIDDLYAMSMDLHPQAVGRNAAFSTAYDQTNLRQVTKSGVQLPPSGRATIIDTRSLAASLQCDFKDIRATPRFAPLSQETLFHVEAGITMADLQQLLDHQLDDKHQRLAIRASGGSPGATLAGALSTATHGAEFNSPLLVDEVRAVHLVGPGGQQWWIEGTVPIADPVKLQKRYTPTPPFIKFIGGGWNAIPGLNAQDVLNAVIVSMGTMGVIYSVVLHVVPQFTLRQVVRPTIWTEILSRAKVTLQDLRAGNVAANNAVLDLLTGASVTPNGTGISGAKNVYANLAINPYVREPLLFPDDRDCWIGNRERITALPMDANNPSTGIGDYAAALSLALSGKDVDRFNDSKFVGRIFDFLSWATNQIPDLANNSSQAGRLLGFIAGLGDPLGGTLAAASIQTIANAINQTKLPDRGHQFLGDMLSGFFHALEGTAPGLNSERTDLSYKVGAIGWPGSGLPGRGLEITLSPDNAFTFLQTILFDDILANTVTALNNPFIGYISVRVCPPTNTLLGQQQFSKFSVTIEVVAYRSPHANNVMDEIQAKALVFSTKGPKPILHWGLENDQVTAKYLATTPLGQPFKAGLTRLQAFTKIRNFIRGGSPPVFDNNFSLRMGL